MYDQQLKLQGIAHDINGLMARAMLAAERLAGHQDGSVASSAGQIAATIDRVVAICRGELVSRGQPNPARALTSASVERMISEIAELVAAESELRPQPIEFYVSVENDVRLSTDPQALFRILFNLSINAANAIARHGGCSIEISAKRARKHVLLTVNDDGPGLPNHVLRYLYPYLGGSARTQTGLLGSGLITAVALSSQLDGELILVNSSSSGTSFCLVLPCEPEEDAA